MSAVTVVMRSWSVSMVAAAVLLLAGLDAALPAERGLSRIEVRLTKDKGGERFPTPSGATVDLEADPVLLTRHFSGVTKTKRADPNAFGTVDIEVLLESRGKTRFEAAARIAKGRRYCLLVDDTVETCAPFAAPGAEENGLVIASVPEKDARRRIAALTAVMRKAARTVKAAERAVPSSSPKALLDHLYRRALKSAGPDWLDGDKRGGYLASGLLELWDAVDVVQAGGNSDAPLDADPLAASANLTLKSFRIGKAEQPERGMASVAVTLDYREPAYPKPVVFTLVKESGRWRISDIEYNSTTLSQQLRIYLSASLPHEARR